MPSSTTRWTWCCPRWSTSWSRQCRSRAGPCPIRDKCQGSSGLFALHDLRAIFRFVSLLSHEYSPRAPDKACKAVTKTTPTPGPVFPTVDSCSEAVSFILHRLVHARCRRSQGTGFHLVFGNRASLKRRKGRLRWYDFYLMTPLGPRN
jgi:hypothetical protein